MANNESDKKSEDDEVKRRLKKKSRNLGNKLVKNEVAKDDEEKIEELSSSEKRDLSKKLRQEARDKRKAELNPEDPADEAIEEFDNKIIDEGVDPQVAFDEVIEEFNEEFEDPVYAEPVTYELNQDEFIVDHEESPDLNNYQDETIIIEHEQARDENIFKSPTEAPINQTVYESKQEAPATKKESKQTKSFIESLMFKRRPKINSQGRKLVVEQKLNREVAQISNDLNYKEQQIRTLYNVAKKSNEKLVSERQILKAGIINSEKPSRLNNQPAEHAEVIRTFTEAHVLHSGIKESKNIGSVVLINESRRSSEIRSKDEDVLNAPEKESKLSVNKRIETLNRTELLKLSSKIKVDGTTLSRIYQSHLIGEKGLRRLVKEHLRGGDIKKALKNEIIEREIDFERDPQLRDRADSTYAEKPDKRGPSATTLDALLEKAENSLAISNEEASFYKAKAEYEEKQNAVKQAQYKVFGILFISIISVLIALIAIMYLVK